MNRNYCLIMLVLVTLALTVPLSAHPAFDVGRGLAALEKGDLERAGSEMQRARFASPEDPDIQYNLGIISYRKRDYSVAAGYFAGAAAQHQSADGRFNSLYNLGNSAFRAGDYAAAVAAYEGSLEVKKDDRAEYNLKVAREKLQKQMEKQQQNQPQGEGDQKQSPDSKDQQNQQDKSGQTKDKQGQQNDANNQNGDQKQNDQNQPGSDQKKTDGEQDGQQKNGENADKQDSKDNKESKDGKDGETGEQSPDNKEQSDSGNKSDAGDTASQTQELAPEKGTGDEEPREDVQMKEDNASEDSAKKDMPEASQRARALKNSKVNPYMIEKVLKEMERREREAQLHYRNEPRRSDEMDPFEMDAEQLREWFENRRRPSRPASPDEPDW